MFEYTFTIKEIIINSNIFHREHLVNQGTMAKMDKREKG